MGTSVAHYESAPYEDPFIPALRRALQVGDARSVRGFLEDIKILATMLQVF